MTNGTLTKRLLKAAKTETGETLLNTAKQIMRRFPLSSEKLVYDSDKGKVPIEAWKILILASVETDKEKFEQCNKELAAAGCELYTNYGRYDTQPEVTAKLRAESLAADEQFEKELAKEMNGADELIVPEWND